MPERMADHWWWRPGCRPGRRQYVWHMLFDDHPAVRQMVRDCQARIAGLPGLDLVPERWLHMTTQIVGYTDEISGAEAKEIAATASAELAGLAPVPVTFGRTLFHPEAVVLAAEPVPLLVPIREAVQAASTQVLGPGCDTGCGDWIPHVTVAYSNADGPAPPVIHAAGRSVGACEIGITEVYLVAQERTGHRYHWEHVAAARLGGRTIG